MKLAPRFKLAIRHWLWWYAPLGIVIQRNWEDILYGAHKNEITEIKITLMTSRLAAARALGSVEAEQRLKFFMSDQTKQFRAEIVKATLADVSKDYPQHRSH